MYIYKFKQSKYGSLKYTCKIINWKGFFNNRKYYRNHKCVLNPYLTYGSQDHLIIGKYIQDSLNMKQLPDFNIIVELVNIFMVRGENALIHIL